MDETVDVLLATYQTNLQFLKKQIDSILKQTYSNIHLIISDDNSKNQEIKNILEEIAKNDNRVEVYFQEENLGYIRNFEFLLKQSKAEYICFSDHDDIWYKDKVEKELKTLKQQEVDMVYCNSTMIDENENLLQKNYFKYKNMPLVKGNKQILGISRYLGLGCSQLFTKSIKEKMLPFTETVMAQDWLVSFLANENKGTYYIDEPLFSYRQHTSNVFGGRNLAQNLANWKEEHGKSYKSYLQYRKEKVVETAYLNGAKMCLQYADDEQTKKSLQKLIAYYEQLEKSKYINFKFISYFHFLAGKNLAKKMIKEFVIFHLPILGYICF